MGPSGQSSSQTQTKALYLSLSAGSVLHTSFPKAALTKIKRREQSLALTALGAPQGKGSLSMSIGTPSRENLLRQVERERCPLYVMVEPSVPRTLMTRFLNIKRLEMTSQR